MRVTVADVGVMQAVPGSASGFHWNIQQALALWAGGIYQNRERNELTDERFASAMRILQDEPGLSSAGRMALTALAA